MSIRIIEGPIGSGKSYYAVQHLIKNYYRWDKDKEVWVENDGVTVYTNIDGFKLGYSLEAAINEVGGLERFFNVDYQKNFAGGRNVVYVLDEAQKPQFFHRKYYNPDVFFFFQYHRHIGVDIYLLTQDVTSLAKELQNLAEFHVKVKGRVRSLTGEFGYNFVSGGESFKTFYLRPRKEIFSLYKSMEKKEVERIPSATRRYALFFFAFIILAVGIFYFGFLNIFKPKHKITATEIKPLAFQNTPQRAQTEKPISTPVPAPVESTQAVIERKGPQAIASRPHRYQVISILAVQGGSSWVVYKDLSDPQFSYRVTADEFDLICRCNSLARLGAGDVVKVQEGEL